MAWNAQTIPSQQDRVVIVTGANAGIGYETARMLAEHGATVVLACRNVEKAERARQGIIKSTGNAQLAVYQLDVSSLASVRGFSDTFRQEYGRLDLLVNNAGIMVPPYNLSVDGFESQLATNYLGHFALTGLLLDLLEKTSGSRIVSLGSIAHRYGKIHFDDIHFARRYQPILAYAQSKLACLMFAIELQEQLAQAGCQAISVAAHPGVCRTNIDHNMPWLLSLLPRLMMQDANAGALPALYAALGEDINGGDYCGPNGFREIGGRAAKVKPHARTFDESARRRLWVLSQELTGVSFTFDPTP